MKKVLLLGASGSIGTQCLDLLRLHRDEFSLPAFSVGHQVGKIPGILKEHPEAKWVCVEEEKDAASLRKEHPELTVYSGEAGLEAIVRESDYDEAVNALVGFVGLAPSLGVLNRNKCLLLANKESLVVGGPLINALLAEGKGSLYPIDSEHAALHKLLRKANPEEVDKLIITASGGPFFHKNREELSDVTPKTALSHPTWRMGPKISIDSATMMNKGFEVIEAMELFHVPAERIEILIQPESHVHSLLKMKDGSYLADVSAPDMHGPIDYALHQGDVPYSLVKANRLEEVGPYHFYPFDPARFPAVGIALSAKRMGGTAMAVLNAADEEAVYAFLRGEMPFLAIEEVVSSALKEVPHEATITLPSLLQADRRARAYVKSLIPFRSKI